MLYMQRPETVKIDALDIGGARFTVSLSGFPARVFQHEFDHLQVWPFLTSYNILQKMVHIYF